MAVTYMRKLEEEPDSYDSRFTSLTKSTNLKVQDWIIDKIKKKSNVLEVGCGPGTLSSKIAKNGNKVIAVDKNAKMIDFAIKKYQNDENNDLSFHKGSFTNLQIEPFSQDVVVSTFMLSELHPLEQQIFLRNTWKTLKPNGRLFIAAEFKPDGIWKLIFKFRRWRYKKKLKRLGLKETQVLNYFYQYLEQIGFKVVDRIKWNHKSIHAIELTKKGNDENIKPGYYRPKLKRFKGLKSQLRIYRCLLTGQVDKVPIEPGIYKSGNPDENSPIIVTGNYEFTYIKVMRDLQGIDAWVLCVDSNGINVWCASRGDDFGNKQLLEALKATGIQHFTTTRKLILPQLSAGGISIPRLPKFSEEFPFKIVYGPVWSKYLKQYLIEKKNRKEEKMKRANFSPFHRLRAGITHITFLFRKIFLFPLIALLIINYIFTWLNLFNSIFWILDILISIGVSNLLITALFPVSNFTRSFINKGIFFGIISIFFLGGLMWILGRSLIYTLLNLTFFFWLSLFTTMSFSGNTMSTNPREIQKEYPTFKKMNTILLIISIILSLVSLIFY